MPQKYELTYSASSSSSFIHVSEVIRSSSSHGTNISSFPKSAYPIPVPIRVFVPPKTQLFSTQN